MSRREDYRRGREAIRSLTGRQPLRSRPTVDATIRLAGATRRDEGFRLVALLATTAVIAVLLAVRGPLGPATTPLPATAPGAAETGRPRPSVERLASRDEIVYSSWADAQRQVAFPLLEPTLLPGGYELKRIYSLPYLASATEPSGPPEHVLAVYGRNDGTTFTFLQYRFGTPDAPTLQTIRSVTRTPPALEMASGPDADKDIGGGAYRDRLVSWISEGLCYRLDGDPASDDLRFVQSALVRVRP
jgi:hypothetical protein